MKRIRFGALALLAALTLCCGALAACAPREKAPENYCTVTFEVEGNTFALKLAEGTDLDLSGCVPAQKEGHSFAGWASGDMLYDPEAVIPVEGDLTLTARWTPKQYTVTFADGERVLKTQTVAHGQTAEAPEDPIKVGYAFAGWDLPLENITDDLTVQAVWTSLYEYRELSDGTLAVSGFAGASQERVELPAEHEGKPITQIESYAFSSDSAIRQVILDGMTHLEAIGDGAFRSCENLETVSLNGLAELKTLGDTVFAGGYNQAGQLLSIDFTGCTALESIGQMFFQYQEKLKAVDLSACTALTAIDRQMFDQCKGLETVVLPRSLESINGDRGGAVNSDFFRGCDSLTAIEVAAGNLTFESENGVLYLRGKTAVIKYPAAAGETAYAAPAAVQVIYGQAFQNARNLSAIDLTACTGLTEIQFSAFSGCSEATLTLPFDADGYYRDGSQCLRGSNWASGVAGTVYQEFEHLELQVEGLTDGMSVLERSLAIKVTATYGEEICEVTVLLNEQPVEGSDGQYVLTLTEGQNTVSVRASCGDVSAQRDYTVTLANRPTVTTTVEDGKVYSGQYIEFDVTARDGAGNALGSDAVSIRTDWGYGLNELMMGVEKTQEGDIVHVRIDFGLLWDFMYYEGGEFTLAVVVTADGQTAQASYTIEHVQA